MVLLFCTYMVWECFERVDKCFDSEFGNLMGLAHEVEKNIVKLAMF